MSNELTETELALVSRVKSETQVVQSSAPEAIGPILSLSRFKRKKRIKGEKRSLIPVSAALILLGLVLTLAFLMVMQTLAEQTGGLGAFSNLSKQISSSKDFSSIINSSGFGWYKGFLEFYNMRWLISGIIFSAFTILSALVFVVDLARKGKND